MARILLLLLASLLAGAPPPTESGVATEWRVRRLALDPGRYVEELTRALGAQEWTERYVALDALARSADAWFVEHVGLAARVRARVDDMHPNVRAAALRALARHAGDDPSVILSPSRVEALAREPLVEVRLGLISWIAAARPADGPEVLNALADDRDDSASGAARRALFAFGPEAYSWQLGRLVNAQGDLDVKGLVRALPELARGGVAPELVWALREAAKGATPASGAHAFVEVAAHHAGLALEVERLVEQWIAYPREPIAGGSRRDVAEWFARRQLLVALAAGAPEDLAHLLFTAGVQLGLFATAVEEDAGAPPPALFPTHAQLSETFVDRSDAATFLLECALPRMDPGRALDQAAPLVDHAPDLAGLVWESVAARDGVACVDRAEYWLARAGASDLTGIVASTLANEMDGPRADDCLRLLAPLLNHPEFGERTFRWVCDRADSERHLRVLHAAWRKTGRWERLERLRVMSRELRPDPFRRDLWRLCAYDGTRTPSVLELLALFVGDEETARRLDEALDDELLQLSIRTPLTVFRRHEWQAIGLINALVAVRGDDAYARVAGVLEQSLTLSPDLPLGESHPPELAKTCAALLGRAPDAATRLAPFLDERVPLRVRLEAALRAIRHGGPVAERAARVLLAGYASSDGELRVRMLGVFGARSDDGSLALIDGVASGGDTPLEERLAALGALARRSELERIADLVARAPGVEVRRAALRYLGERGGAAMHPMLATWLDPAAGLDGGVGELLYGEALIALCSAGALPPDRAAAVFERPLARAAEELERRFRGDTLPRVEFRWRAELEAVAQLAGSGHLSSALAAAESVARLDGRLLFQLGETALREGGEEQRAAADDLFRAAAVALEGEPAQSEAGREAGRIHARALARRLAILEDRGDWRGYVQLCDRLLEAGTVDAGALAGSLVESERREGIDPRLRIAHARACARAWDALSRGERAAARTHAAQAERLIGASRRARQAQEWLERAIADD